MCFHLFVDGFGGMGDALTCCKCGLSKYPESLSPVAFAITLVPGRVIRENHPQHREYVEAAQSAQEKRQCNQ